MAFGYYDPDTTRVPRTPRAISFALLDISGISVRQPSLSISHCGSFHYSLSPSCSPLRNASLYLV